MGFLPLIVTERRGTDRELGRLEGKVDALATAVGTLGGDVKDAVAAMRAQITVVQQDVGKIQTDHETRLRGVENGISELRAANLASVAERTAYDAAARLNRWRIGAALTVAAAVIGGGAAELFQNLSR